MRRKVKKNSRQRVPIWRDGSKSNRETILLLSNNKKKNNTNGCKNIKLPYHSQLENIPGIKNAKNQTGIPKKNKKRNFLLFFLKKEKAKARPPKIEIQSAPRIIEKGLVNASLWLVAQS